MTPSETGALVSTVEIVFPVTEEGGSEEWTIRALSFVVFTRGFFLSLSLFVGDNGRRGRRVRLRGDHGESSVLFSCQLCRLNFYN